MSGPFFHAEGDTHGLFLAPFCLAKKIVRPLIVLSLLAKWKRYNFIWFNILSPNKDIA